MLLAAAAANVDAGVMRDLIAFVGKTPFLLLESTARTAIHAAAKNSTIAVMMKLLEVYREQGVDIDGAKLEVGARITSDILQRPGNRPSLSR